MDKNNIKVNGHKGTWYVIGEVKKENKTYFLLEHNTYGEDACHVAIDENGSLVLEDFYGLEYLSEHLENMDCLFKDLKDTKKCSKCNKETEEYGTIDSKIICVSCEVDYGRY